MAVRAEIRAEGVERLTSRLAQKYEALRRILDQALLQVCEEAVTYSKENKGYKDRTANLKNSISYALFFDGQLVQMHEGRIPKPEEAEGGQSHVTARINEYISQQDVVAPTGYTLVIVAGMNYGIHVEHKGYNVLHMTKYYLADELRKAVEEALEIVSGI